MPKRVVIPTTNSKTMPTIIFVTESVITGQSNMHKDDFYRQDLKHVKHVPFDVIFHASNSDKCFFFTLIRQRQCLLANNEYSFGIVSNCYSANHGKPYNTSTVLPNH